MNGKVYLLPGRDDSLGGLLGTTLLNKGCEVWGREIRFPFTGWRFADQIAAVQEDLAAFEGQTLVADSYGAYLLLHALAERAPFPGRVLLFSPVLGEGRARNGFSLSRPPRAGKLLQLARTGTFPAPAHLAIHTGQEDAGCDPALAQAWAANLANTTVTVYTHQGHRLDASLVHLIILRFLTMGVGIECIR